jgi:hypothetical protein
MKPTIYRASADDALKLAPNLRSADVEEIHAAGVSSPLTALLQSIEMSAEAYAASVDDRVVALFGVSKYGRVWFLGSDEVFDHKHFLYRETRRFFRQWHEKHPVLSNFIYAHNTKHIEFLRSLGCEIFLTGSPLFLAFTHVSNRSNRSGRSRNR